MATSSSGGRVERRDGGFVARVLGAWWDLRASMRGVLDTNPGEGRILSFSMIAGALLYATLSLEFTLQVATDPTIGRDEMSALYAVGLLVYLGIMPLVLIALAGVIGTVARALGGAGNWRDTRAAVAWSWVISAPIFVVLALPGILVDLPLDVERVLEVVGLSFFVVGLSYNVAEAHRFSRVWVVFSVFGGITIGVWSFILYLTA